MSSPEAHPSWFHPCRHNDFLFGQLFFSLLLDAPRVSLALGASISPEGIHEGGDVYFDCKIDARPKPNRIQWNFDVRRTNFDRFTGTMRRLPVADQATRPKKRPHQNVDVVADIFRSKLWHIRRHSQWSRHANGAFCDRQQHFCCSHYAGGSSIAVITVVTLRFDCDMTDFAAVKLHVGKVLISTAGNDQRDGPQLFPSPTCRGPPKMWTPDLKTYF